MTLEAVEWPSRLSAALRLRIAKSRSKTVRQRELEGTSRERRRE
jgi:hypothetical protein